MKQLYYKAGAIHNRIIKIPDRTVRRGKNRIKVAEHMVYLIVKAS